jgi:hypothetical protein
MNFGMTFVELLFGWENLNSIFKFELLMILKKI